jgi:hypothetical protein
MEDKAVEPRPDPENQPVVDTARQALAAMRAGQDDGAVVASVDRTLAREVMLLLFHECSAMVAALGSGGTAPVKMQVVDNDGQEVSIDDADPPVRTAVRTLLAEVHGDTEAAKTHIEIALANAAPDEMATLLVQALRWTLRLSDECINRDLPVADWIADTP